MTISLRSLSEAAPNCRLLNPEPSLFPVPLAKLPHDKGNRLPAGGGGEKLGFAAEGQNAGDDFEVVMSGDGEDDAAALLVLDFLLGVPGVFDDPAGAALGNPNFEVAGLA